MHAQAIVNAESVCIHLMPTYPPEQRRAITAMSVRDIKRDLRCKL